MFYPERLRKAARNRGTTGIMNLAELGISAGDRLTGIAYTTPYEGDLMYWLVKGPLRREQHRKESELPEQLNLV